MRYIKLLDTMNEQINEGIYRSPKWLRNVIDFEINTGQDIKR